MAARWKITSGRSATSGTAASASAKSEATTLTGIDVLAGLVGATTSCSVMRVMSFLPRRPSRSSLSVSLRPTMPAAPRIRMCKTPTPCSQISDTGLTRSLFHGAGHRRHIMLDEEGVKDDQRQRTRQRARHQRTPAIDVAVDELVDDGDRHRLVLGRLQEGQRINEFVPAQGEAENERRDQAGYGQRQHDLDQYLPAARPVDQRAFLQLERDGLDI